MAKRCRECGVEKAAESFPTTTNGRRGTCRACRSEWVKLRNYRLRYGLSREDYEAMLERCDGACEICGFVPDGEVQRCLAVDHDHVTGKVRGLICSPCNRAIGYMRDNPAFLRMAADYLEREEAMTYR